MEKLAKAIKLAAKLREESYDHLSATEKSIKGEKVDFNRFYKLTMEEAADKAAELVGFDSRGTQPVYLLLKHCWNDALEWAEESLKET